MTVFHLQHSLPSRIILHSSGPGNTMIWAWQVTQVMARLWRNTKDQKNRNFWDNPCASVCQGDFDWKSVHSLKIQKYMFCHSRRAMIWWKSIQDNKLISNNLPISGDLGDYWLLGGGEGIHQELQPQDWHCRGLPADWSAPAACCHDSTAAQATAWQHDGNNCLKLISGMSANCQS